MKTVYNSLEEVESDMKSLGYTLAETIPVELNDPPLLWSYYLNGDKHIIIEFRRNREGDGFYNFPERI